jgi:hypothetical protein
MVWNRIGIFFVLFAVSNSGVAADPPFPDPPGPMAVSPAACGVITPVHGPRALRVVWKP